MNNEKEYLAAILVDLDHAKNIQKNTFWIFITEYGQTSGLNVLKIFLRIIFLIIMLYYIYTIGGHFVISAILVDLEPVKHVQKNTFWIFITDYGHILGLNVLKIFLRIISLLYSRFGGHFEKSALTRKVLRLQPFYFIYSCSPWKLV